MRGGIDPGDRLLDRHEFVGVVHVFRRIYDQGIRTRYSLGGAGSCRLYSFHKSQQPLAWI